MSIHELMGIAIGNIGMLLDDFFRLEVPEFHAIYNAWKEQEEQKDRDSWERARMIATICIQPYSKKSLSPKKVLHLPWDDECHHVEVVSKEEDKRRLSALMAKIKKE